MASSKADYLKKYQTDSKKEKKRKKVKKRANLAIHDDDVDWRSLIPKDQPETEEEDEPDEAPQIAEYKDDSVDKIVRWQPVQSSGLVVEDTDLSPARQTKRRQIDSPDLSPLRERKNEVDNDLSPPRRKKYTTSDSTHPGKSRGRQNSPQLIEKGKIVQNKRRHDSLDGSPPRKKRHNSPNASPPRRKRHDSPDASPPRRKRHDSPDASPPRRKRHDSPDASPPRRKRHDSPDASPLRRKRHDSPDTSPLRRKRHDSPDASPPRRSKKHATDDLNPPRTKRSRDLSPPRKRSGDKMSSGAKAGLQNAQALKEENAMVRQRQENFIKEMDPSMSGRHAETVYRDKQGKKVDPRLEKLKQREKERAMEEENEKFMTWGKG